MSINGALMSAVSGLSAQSTAMSMISDNLSNSETVGYKTTTAQFSTLVTEQRNANTYSAGGVRATPNQNVTTQGLIQSSTTTTNLAVDGNGMFPVTDGADGDTLYFTRNGQFSVDADGYLSNGSYVLQGWALNQDGSIAASNTNSANSLEAINLNAFNSSAAATTSASIQANLPATASVGDTFSTALEVYDSLGAAHSLDITWTKTGTGTWTADFSDPTLASDDSVTTGTAGGGPITITFDGDGLLTGTSPDPATLTVTGWSTGASDSTIVLDLGTAGKVDGLTQYAPTDPDADIDIEDGTISHNGLRHGTLTEVEVDTDGTIIAHYSNGQEAAIYKIPLATFPNYNGLSLNSDGIYEQTATSGNYTLNQAGSGAAGDIRGSSLESSTVDTAEEFSRMIICQQAYSAASQMIRTCDDMYDALLSAVR
jgi:flagellar hook protein FlgE